MKSGKIISKISTSKKLTCDLCRKKLQGEEGYVGVKKREAHKYGYHEIKICSKCFDEFVVKRNSMKKELARRYARAIKKKIMQVL